MAEKIISMIPPRQKKQTDNNSGNDETKLRVAAYCRVSTDDEEQIASYDAQVDHYTNYIRQNPEWTLVGIYADEGISATNTKKRTGLMRMIKDCEDRKIDFVISKSVSRFARNSTSSKRCE